MGPEKTHDLYNFMEQISDEMSAEYHRITGGLPLASS